MIPFLPSSFFTASLLENTSKNRYSDVLPIEETRVKITGDFQSDYINANYVNLQIPDGIPMKFICTQAPLLRACEEFWKMVWDQHCPVICALNRLVENHLIKGDRYWPETERMVQFGEIEVKLISTFELKHLEIVLRSLRLSYRDSHKEVYHLHYQGWPDFGVPESSFAIRELVNLMIFYQKKGYSSGLVGPVIVHCSAGIGRSGSFMTIATVMSDPKFKELIHLRTISEQKKKQTQREDRERLHSLLCKLGIKELVLHLRRQRHPGTVQTQHQYIFIYTALLDEFINPTVLSTALCSVFHWHDQNSKKTTPKILSRSGPGCKSDKKRFGNLIRSNYIMGNDLSYVFLRNRPRMGYEEESLSSSSESTGKGDGRDFLCKSGLI
jgi:protein tyrosine phosphatase